MSMAVSSADSTPEHEYEQYNDRSYENPNYRKLYATLSMTSMMGRSQLSDDSNETRSEHSLHSEQELSRELSRELSDTNGVSLEWQKFEDERGPYYWHIPSGTIQREAPNCAHDCNTDSFIYYDNSDPHSEPHLVNTNKCEPNTNDRPLDSIMFTVHSLGWMEVEESQLTTANTTKVIQKCIHDLSTRGDNNAVRCWGDETQQLTLMVDDCNLKLFDFSSDTLLKSQPINGIRVWGVNDNNHFAYVAKDSDSNTINSDTRDMALKCHVFLCEQESAAQRIATFLRDEIIKMKTNNELPSSPSMPLSRDQRPKQLFIYDNSMPLTVGTPTAIEFPTPIEEPRKTIVAKFIGKTKVSKPMGIDILNEALDKVLMFSNEEKTLVSIHISPSNIILESKETNICIAECRVRYLSFLGISGHNVKHCGFIMQVDEHLFEAYCFECEPSSGALCKTIEAACKLRYQKCLDAHRQRFANENQTQPSTIKSAIINVFSKFLK